MDTTTQPDLLYGADAIAAHLGLGRRQVYHRIEAGDLPAFRIGRTVCARRTDLDTWLAKQAGRASA